MNDLGTFLHDLSLWDKSKFGKRNGAWVALPEVSEVFNRVIQVLKNGLGSKSG